MQMDEFWRGMQVVLDRDVNDFAAGGVYDNTRPTLAVSQDGTTAISASTQTLPGEITTGALIAHTYSNGGKLFTVINGDNSPFGYSQGQVVGRRYIMWSTWGTSDGAYTLRRGLLRDPAGKMRYIFDLLTPLVLANGDQFRIDFFHYPTNG